MEMEQMNGSLIGLGFIEISAFGLEDLQIKVDQIKRNQKSLNPDCKEIRCEITPQPDQILFESVESVKFHVHVVKKIDK